MSRYVPLVESKDIPELRLTNNDIIFLEAHDVHCPMHAWQIVQKAIAAKRHDDYARKKGATNEPIQLTNELSLVAGVCQKVTLDDESRKRFKQLYNSELAQGVFRRNEDDEYVVASPARFNPHL